MLYVADLLQSCVPVHSGQTTAQVFEGFLRRMMRLPTDAPRLPCGCESKHKVPTRHSWQHMRSAVRFYLTGRGMNGRHKCRMIQICSLPLLQFFFGIDRSRFSFLNMVKREQGNNSCVSIVLAVTNACIRAGGVVAQDGCTRQKLQKSDGKSYCT